MGVAENRTKSKHDRVWKMKMLPACRAHAKCNARK